MMKKTLLFLAAMLAVIGIQAQTGWILVNSNLDPGRNVGQISVGMNDPDALWALAIGSDGAIVDEYTRSTDGGQTWQQGTFNAGDGLSQLFAIDANTCWAVFNTGATQGLYKTEDGGTTWVKKGGVYGASSFANVIHFFNNSDGVAQGDPVGGYYEIYTTSDGGETWTRVPEASIPPPTTGEYGITGNYCASGNHIWFGTNKGRIYRSADKGLTWEVSLTAFGETQTVAPVFADELNGIVYRSYLDLGIEPEINVTTDGGETWTSLFVTGTLYGRYIEYVPGTEATYVGTAAAPDGMGISYSHDGGNSWSIITDGYEFGATAWINDSTGWAGTFAEAGESVGGMYIYDGGPLTPSAPVTNFEANVTGIAINDYVQFSDLSTGMPTSWAWEFEGGTPATSYLQNPPPIQYTTTGSWDVTLTTSNSYGSDTKTMTDYITVGGVGLNDQQMTTVAIFPNPAIDYLNLSSNGRIDRVEVYNLAGQLSLAQAIGEASARISLDALQAGVYQLKVYLGEGIVHHRLIVR